MRTQVPLKRISATNVIWKGHLTIRGVYFAINIGKTPLTGTLLYPPAKGYKNARFPVRGRPSI